MQACSKERNQHCPGLAVGVNTSCSGNGEKLVLNLDWHFPQYTLDVNGYYMITGLHVQINLENGEREVKKKSIKKNSGLL